MLTKAEEARLAALRRLHHHLANGGRPQPRDGALVGGREATTENVAAEIEALERLQSSPSSSEH